MDKRNVAYWITTGLVALLFLFGGTMDVLAGPEALAVLSHLGYPLYFARIIGVWKVLGAVAIVAPRFPRLKEWAYAGMIFDVTGASISHAASGDPLANVLGPLVIGGVVLASWALRPASRKLASPAYASVPVVAQRTARSLA